MKLKIFQKQCRWIPLLGVIFICIFSYTWLLDSIPDKIRIVVDREENFEFRVPVTGVVDGLENLSEEQVHIDMKEQFTLQSSDKGEFSIICKLFGIFSLKEVTVEVIDKEMVVPCGIPIGIYVETAGILAIGTGEVVNQDGIKVEPAKGIVKSGDYIQYVNNVPITSKEELLENIEMCGGSDIILGIRRNNEQIDIKVAPVKTAEGTYKIGVWVRDDMAGIGTMTCYTTEQKYVALGHPISDIDTGSSLQIQNGKLYETNIIGITKGEKGHPGEMAGVINYNKIHCLGTVEENNVTGISGTLENIPDKLNEIEYVEVGLKQDTKLGKAVIISYVSGTREEYDIEITAVNYSTETLNKGIEFKVVDSDLLELTGGIVQGMSGSPVIQNGRIVGAVTHVLVNDPTRGYGIFIENMLEAAE